MSSSFRLKEIYDPEQGADIKMEDGSSRSSSERTRGFFSFTVVTVMHVQFSFMLSVDCGGIAD